MLQKLLEWGHFALTNHWAIIFAIVVTVIVTVLFLRNRKCPKCGGRKFVHDKKTTFAFIVTRWLATDVTITRCRNNVCKHVLSESSPHTRPATKIETLGLKL